MPWGESMLLLPILGIRRAYSANWLAFSQLCSLRVLAFFVLIGQ